MKALNEVSRAMSPQSISAALRLCVSALLLLLAACGGGGGTTQTTTQPAAIHTLAYVVTECRDAPGRFFERYKLVVRNGEHEPVTVAEIAEQSTTELGDGYCQLLGDKAFSNEIERGGFTRLGVSPDGSTVVFEETDELSTTFHDFLASEQKGIFALRADGTGLHRVGAPTGVPPYAPNLEFVFDAIAFSPDGRLIALTDKGPGPSGEDAGQIIIIDLATGARNQITHLPPITSSDRYPAIFGPIFLDLQTIAFFTSTGPTDFIANRVKVDGSEFEMLPVTAPPGAHFVPQFAITGNRLSAFPAVVPGHPSGPPLFVYPANHFELFSLEGPNFLQFTNFQRYDTAVNGALIDPDARRVFFAASADPLGTNPNENCQLFSIDRNGADLRQLTNIPISHRSLCGCTCPATAYGCGIPALRAQDALTSTLVFSDVCDIFGTTGTGQIFAVRPDGSGSRALTNLRGIFTDADGAVHVELPIPFAYGPYVPGGTNLP